MLTPPSSRGVIFDGLHYDALNQLGAKPAQAIASFHAPGASTLGSGLVGGESPLEAHTGQPWHPDSPLFWFGMLAAVTFGLIGASTAVRVGPFRAGVTAGKTD